KLYGDERRTLVMAAAKASVEQRVVVEPVTVVLSQKGFVRSRTGHGHDASLMNFKMGDGLAWSAECTTDDTLILVGSNGRVYSVAVDQLPPARGDGLPITSFIDLEAGTEIVGCVAGPADRRVLLANDAGFGLMCSIGNMTARVRSGKAFMSLEEGDTIFAPMPIADGASLLACLSAEGRMLVFGLDEIRTLTGGGKGVTLMDLNPGEKLIACAPLKTRAVRVAGKGRTTMREKVLAHGDFERHVLRRARKGKPLEIRFVAQTVQALDEAAVQQVPDPVHPGDVGLI
ncbi:MAG: DNA gyrase C-terminal beta-propeller domain-containing protein, partial [Duodenibacillus sp.]